ncbi:MAG: hypothetical protein H6828_08080 [Planctomycetes bacterium]|nr:hypothetical protein [Planctomycetota bacterium]
MFEADVLWFSLPALIGSGLFAVRMALMLLGGDDGGGHDFGDGGHVGGGDFGDGAGGDGDFGDVDHGQDHAFQILSVQSVAVFSMGFGWTAIGCLFGGGLSHGASGLLGVVGGVVLVWILARALGAMRELESSGNVAIGATLGLEGEVYARVPAHGGGKGQVRLIVGQRQRLYNAVSQAAELDTRTRVRVVSVNSDNTLTVEAV